jgi:glycosyltransferase involved in cell wall biosynthesis
MGHTIADPSDYDVALVFIEASPRLDAKKPYVQRLDGIWFKPDEMDTKNGLIEATYNNANAVIFQSEFDRTFIQKHWGETNCAVIHNGITVPQERVKLKSQALVDIRNKYDKVYVASSNWHPQKRLRANIELFKHIREKTTPNCCLIVMGSDPDCLIADPDVFYTGSVPEDVYMEVYAMSDIMFHLAWLDHCPNVVLEALSMRVPVMCSEQGGTRELIDVCGTVLFENQTYDFNPIDYDHPPEIDVTQVTALPVPESWEFRRVLERIDIKHVAESYEKVLSSVV